MEPICSSKQGHQTGCPPSEQSFSRKWGDRPDFHIKLHSVISEDSVPRGLACWSSGIHLSKLNQFILSHCILKWKSCFNTSLYSNIAGYYNSMPMLSIRELVNDLNRCNTFIPKFAYFQRLQRFQVFTTCF